MTITDITAPSSSWTWWEGRRLAFNIALFIAGWAGFGLQALAMYTTTDGWSEPLPVILWQGLVYAFYMLAANLFYLLGAVVEAILKPTPVRTYRRQAWALGVTASIGLPLLISAVMALSIINAAFAS